MLEQSWVGRRVVVRRAVEHAGSGRLRFADAVGDLLELSDDAAVIETRNGPITVAVGHIAVAKIAEPSTAEILELERIGARGWRAAEVVELGGWTLRADAGFTGRANSVLPGRQLHAPLAEVLDDARAWYAARGLPLRIQVPLPGRHILDNALTDLGWGADEDVHVLAVRFDVLLDRMPPRPHAEVELSDQPDNQWLGRYRDGTAPPSARALLTRHERVTFASIRENGRTVGVARGAVDDGWLGLTAVEVDPARRRQGLASELVHALWRWSSEQHGATRSYLQASSSNAAGLALYDRLGYWAHHDYRYRTDAAHEVLPTMNA